MILCLDKRGWYLWILSVASDKTSNPNSRTCPGEILAQVGERSRKGWLQGLLDGGLCQLPFSGTLLPVWVYLQLGFSRASQKAVTTPDLTSSYDIRRREREPLPQTVP